MEESINLDSFEPMINACKSKQVNLFVYASTSSVYGLKKEKDIHEEMQLEPLTDYSKYKADCEKILFQNNYIFVKNYKVDGFYIHESLKNKINIKFEKFFQINKKSW